MKPTLALVEWYGPYDLQAAVASAIDFDDGLYMVVGKCKRQRVARLQYVGLAKTLHGRLKGKHEKIATVCRDTEIWLGEVSSPRSPGRKIKVTDRMLDLVEWAHVFFLQLPLNEKKKKRPPDRDIIVYNRWWKTDQETARLKRPHRGWPDLIDHIGMGYDAKRVWFGVRQELVAVP